MASESDKKIKKEQQKTDNLKTWLESKPYWEQYLWHLHITKETLDESDIKQCYQYLLEDSDIVKKSSTRLPIVFSTFDLYNTEALSKEKVTIDKIENFKNINALDEGCVLEFGKNLTIIYGDNGTGKSGVGRLLSNACYSRKPRKILPNTKIQLGPTITRAQADFHITDASVAKIINYTIGDKHDALKSFSIFDQECSLIHLNNDNTVDFVPSKMHIFDEIFNSIVKIESKIEEDNKLKIKDNPTEGIFTSSSKIKEFIDSLSCDITDEKIDEMLTFTDGDKDLLDKKVAYRAEKQKQDTSKQKKELIDECNDLNELKATLTAKSVALSEIKANKVNTLINKIKEKKEIAEKLSIKNFEFHVFKNIGSLEWRSLIAAAQVLYSKETVENNGVEPEYCLLCRQALGSKEKTLFNEYWNFLKSTAETELASAREDLKKLLEDFYREKNSWPVFSDTEVAIKILKKDIPEQLEKIRLSFQNINMQLSLWINNVELEQLVSFTDFGIDINPITVLINYKKEAEARLVNPEEEIKNLTEEIIYLSQKQRAFSIIKKIKEYVSWLRWQKAVGVINLSSFRGNTTRKKTEIMNELVISQYVDIFNKEIKKLDCNFGLIVESHGRAVQTVKRLKLDFARDYSPSEILSEGEQTVSALADFLTEAKLNKNNSGVIFDDPVNSLDHLRENIIAQRLVEEAKERQVVVFTHNIIFLLDLQYYADRDLVEHIEISMRKSGDKIGIIDSEIPWFARNVRERVGYLKNELVSLQKMENNNQDEYRNKVKLWYELLRESWERAVEERLFKKVVQRFNKSVQTQRLNQIKINQELIEEVNNGMNESSKWLHDTAPGINPSVPNNEKLKNDLNLLEKFIDKCKSD